ncbi:MAG: ATP-dependent DNA ligase, partial [Microbacterium sp.]|nr:ATP-dependent DNA ligase [Microbacterium sp.]
MLLAEVVATTARVAATPSRRAKTDALAGLLARLRPEEIAVAIGLLTASPRQGRLGVGWRGMSSIEAVHAAAPTLTLADVDDALGAVAAASGDGSSLRRTTALTALAARATADEWDFLARAMLGE